MLMKEVIFQKKDDNLSSMYYPNYLPCFRLNNPYHHPKD